MSRDDSGTFPLEPVRVLPVRLYAQAVRAFPPRLRRAFGREMVATFAAAYAARERRGRMAAARYALRALADALATGLRERWRRRSGGEGNRSTGRGDRRSGGGKRPAGVGGDLRLAVRSLARTPLFAVTALLVVAIGVGINGAVFTALEATLLATPPYPEPERLVLLDLIHATPGSEPRQMPWSWAKYEILAGTEGLAAEPVAAYAVRDAILTGRGDPVRLNMEVVTGDYLDLLGKAPTPGRGFSAAGEPEAREVVLGRGLWRERFGADPGVVGRTVTLGGEPMVVVGVGPPGFRGLSGQADLWVPVGAVPLLVSPTLLEAPQAHWLQVVARLRPGSTVQRLRSQMDAVGRRVNEALPVSDSTATIGGGVRRLVEARRNPEAERAVSVATAAAVLLLLIACANLAGLLRARGEHRRREIAVRLALGASRTRVVLGQMVEAILLAVGGGILGVGVAAWGAAAIARAWPSEFASGGWNLIFVDPGTIAVDTTTVAYMMALALLTGAVFGALPALRLTRTDLAGVLREGAGATRHRRRRGTGGRQALVTAEIALALVLAVGAGLMVTSLGNLLEVERGFDAADLLTFSYSLPRSSAAAEAPAAFHEEFLRRVRGLPGVVGATAACVVPLGGHCWIGGVKQVGDRVFDESEWPDIGVHPVEHDYFATLRIPVLRGRTFEEHDRSGSAPVAVINETAARRLFGDADPVGERLAVTAGVTADGPAEVIGVVGDVLYAAPETGVMPEVYLSHRQEPGRGVDVLVRTSVEPFEVLPMVREQLALLDPDLPILGATTVADIGAAKLSDTRAVAWLLSAFAGVALLLAVTGVWGVVAYTVSQRSRELGIRLALGARAHEVVGRVLRQGLHSAVLGLLLGIVLAIATTRVIGSLLYEVGATDPAVFAVTATALLAAVLLAAYLPARRATRVDPVEVLKAE